MIDTRQAYRCNGFAGPFDLSSTKLLAELQQLSKTLHDKQRNVHIQFPIFKELLQDEALNAVIKQLHGDCYVWQTEIFKGCHAPVRRWHSDNYTAFLDPQQKQFQLQISISPSTQSNCLCLIPWQATHDDAGQLRHKHTQLNGDYGDLIYPKRREFRIYGKHFACMSPGQFYVFENTVLHRSHSESGNKDLRCSLTVRYCGKQAVHQPNTSSLKFRAPYLFDPLSPRMQYHPVAENPTALSRIVFGGASLRKIKDDSNTHQLLDYAIESGINTFDLARQYDRRTGVEKRFGRWLRSARIPRDRVFVIGKCAHPKNARKSRFTAGAIREDVLASLESMQLDYLDLMLLHRDDVTKPIESVVDELNRLKQQGLIRCLGISNWSHARIVEAKDYSRENSISEFVIDSSHVNVLNARLEVDAGVNSIDGKEVLTRGQRLNVLTLAHSPLLGGKLASEERFWQFVNEEMAQCPTAIMMAEDLMKTASNLQVHLSVAVVSVLLRLMEPIQGGVVIGGSRTRYIDNAVDALQYSRSDEVRAFVDRWY